MRMVFRCSGLAFSRSGVQSGSRPDIAGFLSGIHYVSAWVILGLFGLHMGAVLMHHVLRRDETLHRIL